MRHRTTGLLRARWSFRSAVHYYISIVRVHPERGRLQQSGFLTLGNHGHPDDRSSRPCVFSTGEKILCCHHCHLCAAGGAGHLDFIICVKTSSIIQGQAAGQPHGINRRGDTATRLRSSAAMFSPKKICLGRAVPAFPIHEVENSLQETTGSIRMQVLHSI